MRALLAIALTLVAPAAPAQHVWALDPQRYHIGDGAYQHTTDFEIVDREMLTGTHLEVPFRLPQAATVAVRLNGLWGVGGIQGAPHNNWVHLDGTPVGRILPGARSGWTSASRRLGPGNHTVRIVSLGPGDHDDFVLEGISVVTVERVEVTPSGPSRIWTASPVVAPSSALGATAADVDAWLRIAARSWERRQQTSDEEFRLVLSDASPLHSAGESAEARRAGARTLLYAQPREPASFIEDPDAIEILEMQLEPGAESEPPLLVMECRVDQAFVVRRTQPSLHWRWLQRGGEAVGGGPESLHPFDDRVCQVRFRLPIPPPGPGDWTLEVTLIAGSHGARASLAVSRSP